MDCWWVLCQGGSIAAMMRGRVGPRSSWVDGGQTEGLIVRLRPPQVGLSVRGQVSGEFSGIHQGSIDVDGLERRVAPENFVAAKSLGDDGYQHPGALGAELSPTTLGSLVKCSRQSVTA